MTDFHRFLAYGVVGGLALLFLSGLVIRISRKAEAPTWFWAAQHWMENILLVQVVLGIVLFLMGKRVAGGDLVFLHYFYGSLFPLIALVSGRIAGLRREHHEYVGLVWGAFFAFGLTSRAMMTGLGIGI